MRGLTMPGLTLILALARFRPDGINGKMGVRKATFLRIAGFNAILILGGLLILELVFGSWFHPDPIKRLNLVRDCEKHYDATLLYAGATGIVYTRDEWGLRGKYPALDDIDIVTLGGSATDQRYITDGSTWQDVIVREFQREKMDVSVVNAGVDGQSTFGHIKDFDWWFPTLPGFKPRYVLFYIASNDIFKNNDSQFDALVDNRPPDWKVYVRERSVIYRFVSTAEAVYEARQVHKISHRKEPFGAWEWTTKPLVRNHHALVEVQVERYRKAVRLLASKTRELGAEPIFVTQSLSLYRFRPDGRIEGRKQPELYAKSMINGVDYYYIMREFWAATMDECAKAGGVCIDAGSDVRWQEGDFYDNVHNTPPGAERLGMYLYSRLKSLPVGTTEVAH